MSYLASQQRGYDSLSHPDLPQHPPIHSAPSSRLPMHPPPSFNDLPPSSFSPAPSSSMPSAQSNFPHPSHLSDRPHITLPRLGQTRCCEFFPVCRRSFIDRTCPPSPVPFPCLLANIIAIDWTLLTADLTFLYLDPVLASHLGEQADLLIGKPLLAYVHPDEQASAKVDLGAVLESRTLHGSVTR